MGYCRDPMIVKLMNHLRTKRSSRLKAAICGITTRAPTGQTSLQAIIAGARSRAEELGYSFDVIVLTARYRSKNSLQRILTARGIEGVLLLPMAEIGPFTYLDRWDEFSVVSTTLSVTEPVTDRVVTNYFDNVLRICEALTQKGYRRLGLVTTHEHDLRVGYRLTAAMAWHNTYGGTEAVPPLLLDRNSEGVRAWFGQQRPDVIIVHAAPFVKEIKEALGSKLAAGIGFASASTLHFEGRTDLAGIDERPSELGKAAVDVLAGLIQNGNKGLPVNHRVTMVEGVFLDGPSLKWRAVKRP